MKKENIKLVVSDFDGTLLPYESSRVCEEILRAVEVLIEKNIVFAISSGRTYGELQHYLSQFGDKIYYTCCDGALTIKNGKPIYERRIENSDLELFFKHKTDDFSFVLHGAFNNFAVGHVPSEASRFDAKPVNGIFQIKEKIFKITSYGEPPALPEYSSLRTHWDGGANRTAQYVNRYCNKGTALSDLQTRLMLTKYDTAVLGDRRNDVCMVKGAKLSFCIGNRCDELAEACTYGYDRGESALEHILSCLN